MGNKKEQDVIVEDKSVAKVCKKCGDPLRSKSKHKYCENCRRQRAKTRREILGTVGAFGLTVASLVPGIKHFTKK